MSGSDDDPLDEIFVDGDDAGDADDLDALVDDATEAREQYQQSQERLSAVKERLHELLDDVETSIEGVDPDRVATIRTKIERGEYADARDAIRRLARENTLRFDDAEKQQFAQMFADSWNDLVSRVEDVQTALVDLELRNGMDEDDVVSLLNGKHRINKSTTREVFDASERIAKMNPENPDDAARLLAAVNRDLTIEATRDVLEAIQEEAGQ